MMTGKAKISIDQGEPSTRSGSRHRYPIIVGALVCALLGWGIYALWQLDDIPLTSRLKEQLMHRKTRTMSQILDGLVRGDLGRVESSAQRMWEIGQALNWYSSSTLYENNNELFRESTAELLNAARRRDHAAAKESALRLERSCIDCHALINQP